MSLHPCPLCGESKGYDKAQAPQSTALYCRACDCRVTINSAVAAKLRQSDDAAWNAAAAHAQGLRERIKVLEAQLAQRVPLTQKQVFDLWDESVYVTGSSTENFARAIERAHGIGQSEGGKR